MPIKNRIISEKNLGRIEKSVVDYIPAASSSKFDLRFASQFFQPDPQSIYNDSYRISKLLFSKDISLNIPVKEKAIRVADTFEILSRQVGSESIVMIDDENDDVLISAVRAKAKISMVQKKHILKSLRWDKIMKLCGLKEIPRGKGTAVLAGYLFNHFLDYFFNRRPKWIFHTDADISNFSEFNPLNYLAWGVIHSPLNTVHVKMAQSGRNNESTMAIRSSLQALKAISNVCDSRISRKISKRSEQLFERLVPYKWMLSGTFVLDYNSAMSRPVASGYLDETLICAFVEDLNAKFLDDLTVQVSNPNLCVDGKNDFRKENIILQLASNFIITLALINKGVDEWGVEDLGKINRKLMSGSVVMGIIPSNNDSGPVIGEAVLNEKILPSVKMLQERDLIDYKRAKEIMDLT